MPPVPVGVGQGALVHGIELVGCGIGVDGVGTEEDPGVEEEGVTEGVEEEGVKDGVKDGVIEGVTEDDDPEDLRQVSNLGGLDHGLAATHDRKDGNFATMRHGRDCLSETESSDGSNGRVELHGGRLVLRRECGGFLGTLKEGQGTGITVSKRMCFATEQDGVHSTWEGKESNVVYQPTGETRSLKRAKPWIIVAMAM